ncbi:MAG: hypothetical protein U9P14_00625 [Gemmatimonadota bacterium]|nr:hypothetical protein [Gemmatimonadota bacterium]
MSPSRISGQERREQILGKAARLDVLVPGPFLKVELAIGVQHHHMHATVDQARVTVGLLTWGLADRFSLLVHYVEYFAQYILAQFHFS